MTERRRMLLITASVVLVLGGAAFYLLGIYRPALARATAQAEIAAWEERWLRARTCVIGSSQASASIHSSAQAIAEALAIRDLGADVSNRSGCAKVVGDLTRGPGAATELDDVELAWPAIDRAAGKIAMAFVQQLGVTPQPARDPTTTLAEALDEMDRAHAALRAAAALPALPARTTATLPRATLTPLAIDGTPLEMLEAASVTNGALVARVTLASGRALVVHAPGKQPIIMRQDRALRSFPDLGWGMQTTERGLALGPLDLAGRLTKQTIETPLAQPSGLFVVGNATTGAVAYALLGDTRHGRAESSRQDVQLGIARVEAGRLVIVPALAAHDTRHDVEPGGRALVAWSDRDTIRGALVAPGTIGTPLVLGEGSLGRADRGCLTATHAWLALTGRVVAFDATSAHPHELADHVLVGCTRDTALLRARGSLRFALCRERCRTVELATAHPSSVVAVVGDQLVAIAGARAVLGLWAEGGATRYVALAEPFTPMYAVSDGAVIDVLGRTGSALAIARVPAR